MHVSVFQTFQNNIKKVLIYNWIIKTINLLTLKSYGNKFRQRNRNKIARKYCKEMIESKFCIESRLKSVLAPPFEQKKNV